MASGQGCSGGARAGSAGVLRPASADRILYRRRCSWIPGRRTRRHAGQRAIGSDGGGEEAAGDLADDQVTLASQQQYALPGGYEQQLQMARNLATGEPQRAAQVVRGWVADDA